MIDARLLTLLGGRREIHAVFDDADIKLTLERLSARSTHCCTTNLREQRWSCGISRQRRT
jgi:hypothetical protein